MLVLNILISLYKYKFNFPFPVLQGAVLSFGSGPCFAHGGAGAIRPDQQYNFWACS